MGTRQRNHAHTAMPPLQNHSFPGLSTATATTASPSSAVSLPTTATTPLAHSTQTHSYLAYSTAGQLESLYAKQRGSKLAESKWHSNRNFATGFIHAVASRLGLPQRTTATAQLVYQRFHLFYPPSDFVLHEVALASLVLAAKLNDTPKKAREILLASYAFRFPELVKGEGESTIAGAANSSSSGNSSSGATLSATPVLAGTKRKAQNLNPSASSSTAAIGSISESDIDALVLETDRKRLMALEKLLLESICFNFQLGAPSTFALVIKICKRWKLPKSYARTAWRVAADMFRVTAPLQYPPNVVASASVYAAALLAIPPPPSSAVAAPSSTSTSTNKAAAADPRGVDMPSDALEEAAKTVVERFSKAACPPSASTGAGSSSTIGDTSSLERELGCHIEDIEEAIHDLLDLYLAQTRLLPPTLFSSSSTVAASASSATPSPQSPADHLSDLLTSSPTSHADHATSTSTSTSAGGATRRSKLKQHEFSPPPLALMDWLNTYRYKSSLRSKPGASGSKSAKKQSKGGQSTVSGTTAASGPVTTKFTTVLTDLKIYLRQIEYERQKADDHFLSSHGYVAEVVYPPLSPPTTTLGEVVDTTLFLQINVKPTVPASNGEEKDEARWIERIKRRKWVAMNRLLPLPVPSGALVQPHLHQQQTQTQTQAVEGLIAGATRFLF